MKSSPAVLDEASGPPERSHEWLTFLENRPLLPVEPAIGEIAETYIRHGVMPADPTGDALHLALASFHKCDFLTASRAGARIR